MKRTEAVNLLREHFEGINADLGIKQFVEAIDDMTKGSGEVPDDLFRPVTLALARLIETAHKGRAVDKASYYERLFDRLRIRMLMLS